MEQFSKNFSGITAAGDHFKNGLITKSMMSRGISLRKAVAVGVILLLNIVCSLSVVAQDEITIDEFLQHLSPLVQQVQEDFDKGDFQSVEKTTNELLSLFARLPKNAQEEYKQIGGELYFALTVCLSAQNKIVEAVNALETAVKNYGFNDYSRARRELTDESFSDLLGILRNLNRQENHENIEIPLSDAGKIFGLSKCWSEAKYNFVYFDRLTFNWDSLYRATIPIVLATENDFEYFRELQRFVATLRDGHTSVGWNHRDLWDNWATIPVVTRLLDGKMIVTEVLNDELRELQGIKRGLEVVSINGIDAHEHVLTNIKPFVFSSTEQWTNLIAYGRDATRGNRSESIRLTFKDDNGRVFESTISRTMSENEIPQASLFNFELLEENIGLLKIDDFWRNNFTGQFDAIYEKILATDALIIDIRGNGGGNSNNSVYVLSHLTDENFNMSAWSSPRYIPAFASWNRPREWHFGEPWIGQPARNKPIYDKPVALLIDESTFSAAEDFCVGFRSMNRGIIIGTPSGGSTGNPIGFNLPGGGWVQFCSKKDTYPDGTEFVGVGILPDIEVRETVSSFLSKAEIGIDNSYAKRKAIEVLKTRIKER